MVSPCRIFSGSAEAEIAREKCCDKEDGGGDGSFFCNTEYEITFIGFILKLNANQIQRNIYLQLRVELKTTSTSPSTMESCPPTGDA